MIDKIHYNRIITNIIKNAMQAIDESIVGLIEINIEHNNEKLSIAIKDNGKGIAPELYDKILQPHFSTKSNGMGIGLSMVKSMVENASGTINFTSVLEIGTTFTLEFPIIKN
jgi:signal transduction histidine kinase